MSAAGRDRRRAELELLYQVFELPMAERVARIEEVERSDAELAFALRRMLSTADAIAVEGGTEKPAPPDPHRVGPDTLIGEHFRLLHLLGAGGMGEVHLARRSDDIEQRVAIKILHGEGVALTRARARREQQILARLVHPNIAGLIDAGSTATGRPWFAMDYVDGERLLDWCDNQNLGLQARVRLFAQICRAVQFAHRNLVLHRDLKPSNILVDREGVPKLLDFGIAKVIGGDDPHETRTLAFTPAYAAPEQLRGEPATTASDVYQLGIVLYELASGVPAHRAREAAARNDESTERLPSAQRAFAAFALSDSAGAERCASARSSTFARLGRTLKGDLGRIIAKASASRASERYDTAQSLADDLERWLADAPVSAHRGTLAYRLRKLVERHTFASAAIFALSLGLVAATVIAIDRARHEREQRQQAERQRATADEQRKHAEAMLGFLRDVFRESDQTRTGDHEMTAAELFTRASAKLDQRTQMDEVTRAVLLSEVAGIYVDLDKAGLAIAPAERAYASLLAQRASQPVEYLQSAETLADTYLHAGRYRDVVQTVDAALQFAEHAVGGASHSRSSMLPARGYAQMMLGHPAEAQADVKAALAEFEEMGDRTSPDLAHALNAAAVVVAACADNRSAIALNQRLVSIAASDTEIEPLLSLTASANMAGEYLALGESEQAIAILAPLLPRLQTIAGLAHSVTIYAQIQLAQAYLATDQVAHARELIDAMQAVISTAPADAESRLGFGIARARLALHTGNFRAAESIARDLVDSGPAVARPQVRLMTAHELLGEALLQQGDFAAAIAMAQRAVRASDEAGNHRADRIVAAAEDTIGRSYLLQGDAQQAQPHLQRAVALYGESQGAEKPNTLRSEIHQLWANALGTRDPQLLDRLVDKRAALVDALGSEDRLQVWQLDRLLDELSRKRGRPGIDAARLKRAENGLSRLANSAVAPNYAGLSDF